MPGPHCFNDLFSATFTMLFNVAFFSSLLLIPVVLAVPHALGASVARLRERRLSQPGSYIVDAVSDTQYYSSWAGASLSEGNVRSIFHGLFCDRHLSHPHSFYITGNFVLGHRNVHRPHHVGFDRGFCRCLG